MCSGIPKICKISPTEKGGKRKTWPRNAEVQYMNIMYVNYLSGHKHVIASVIQSMLFYIINHVIFVILKVKFGVMLS